MSTIPFLAEWAIRSAFLILSGTLMLRVLRVKDPAIRLAAWTAMLCISLVIPVLNAALPGLPLKVATAPGHIEAPLAVENVALPAARTGNTVVTRGWSWQDFAKTIYVVVAFALLLRLVVGLAFSLRLLRQSRIVDVKAGGIEVRESDRVTSPVTLGILRPKVVLPPDWNRWSRTKLEAVLAHEGSHIRRQDPALQTLSTIHRALLWHSPLSWFLHKSLIRAAEEASDDAAVTVTSDRAAYAEVLLDFMQRKTRSVLWKAIPMARYGQAEKRIHRILDATTLSHGVTRWSVAAILILGSPLAYIVAAARPQSGPSRHEATVFEAPIPAVAEKVPATAQNTVSTLRGLGTVAGLTTVTIKPRIDGLLTSVNFKEGDIVQQGQLLASLDPKPYHMQVYQAELQLGRDQASLAAAQNAVPKQAETVVQIENNLEIDQASIEQARLQLSYTEIRSPITGVAGLRLIDPGNIVHAADATGLVIITEVQPIAVVFTIPETNLQQVLALVRQGAILPVEAWDRDDARQIGSGHLVAVDNQIDEQTGTVKLKAVFDNKDSALFPHQFVNVRLLLTQK
jgi:RND family efflux transporter MFP subunit